MSMDRITENSGGSFVELKDHEPYPVFLAKMPEVVNGSEQYPAKRLEVTLQLVEGDENDTVKDWLSLTLRQTPGGDVSKLRAFLNALAGKPEATAINYFDPNSFEWSYDGVAPYSQLCPGLPCIIRGKNKPKTNGTLRYRVETYQPAAAGAVAPIPPPPGTPAGFQQISSDGKYGWNGSAWVEIPVTVATPPPPPPPPAPAAKKAAAKVADVDPDEIPF